MAASRLGVVTVLSLILAAAGVLAPIAWDRYQRRAALELRQSGSSIVVSPTQVVEKLQIEYDGQPVPSVAKSDFVLSNSGRTPIRQSDVVEPVRVAFDGGQVLDLRITKVLPANLAASLSVDLAKHVATIEFPLLNPGDAVYFSTLVSSTAVAVSASARIVGVSGLDFAKNEASLQSLWRRVPWTTYVAGAGTAFCLLIAATMLHMLGAESAIAALVVRGAIALPTGSDPSTYRLFLDGVLRGDKAHELKALRSLLASHGSAPLSDDQSQKIQAQLRQALQNTSAARGGFWLMAIVASFGIWYVVTNVLAVAGVPAA